MRSLILFVSALLAALPGKAQETELPPYDASAPDAPTLTAEALPSAERFWPYHVRLLAETEGLSIPPGLPGVLLRLESDGRALVDFGRDGLHRIAPKLTDLLAGAEAIRSGAQKKDAPNFTFMIGTRLVRADGEKIEALPYAAATRKHAYLCAFVPVEGKELETMLAALPAFEPAPGVMPILFPLGEQDDRLVRQRLRAIERPWAFVYDHLADSYALGLLPPDLTPPALLLLSAEGRLIATLPWRDTTPAELSAALAALPAP